MNRNNTVLLPDFNIVPRKVYNIKTRCGGTIYSPPHKCPSHRTPLWLLRHKANKWRQRTKSTLFINNTTPSEIRLKTHWLLKIFK